MKYVESELSGQEDRLEDADKRQESCAVRLRYLFRVFLTNIENQILGLSSKKH